MKDRPDIDAALSALIEVVHVSLNSNRHDRFGEAERICKVAQQLLQAVSDRVADHQEDELGMYENIPQWSGRIRANPARLMPTFQGPLDQNELMRNLLTTVTNPLEANKHLTESRRSKVQADELDSLISIQARLDRQIAEQGEEQDLTLVEQRTIICERINQLIQKMKLDTEVEQGTQNEFQLVHTDFSRGHQTAGKRREDDPESV